MLAALIIFGVDRLWRFGRVQHFSSTIKIMAIAERIGVSDEDFDKAIAVARASSPGEEWAALERDIQKHF